MTSTPPPPPGAPPPPPGAPPPPPGAPPPPVGGGVPPGVPYQAPTSSGFGPGQIVALIGGAVVLISGWLNWVDFEGVEDGQGSAYKFPAGFLVDNQIEDDAGISVGVLVLLAAALIVVGALAPGVRWLAIVGGGGAVVVAGLYLFQWNGLISDANDAGGDISLFDFITFIPILTILGGIAAAVGGILALQKR